jgi:beta-phosphoglucomutase
VNFRAIIFDLDGVVIDTEPLHREAKQSAFSEFGLAVPDHLYAEFQGRSDRDMAEYVVGAYGPASLDFAEVLARKHAIFESMEPRLRPVAGALDFIHRARARCEKLALATSATRHNQEIAFARFALSGCFDAVVTAEDVARTKPHPDPYLRAVEKLGVPASACLVIEDSPNGILSAKAAGCYVTGILTSFSRSRLVEANPDHIAQSFAELGAIL